jgi:hypothetical protein
VPETRFPSSASGACCPGPPLPSIASASAGAAAMFESSSVLWTSPTSSDRASSDYGCNLSHADRSGPTSRTPLGLQVVPTRARCLGPRSVRKALAMRRPPMLPSAFLYSVGTLTVTFRGSILCPRVPLSTLRRHPCGCRRMTRGRRAWLDLQRTELASAATCRSPGARRRLDPGCFPSASRAA